MIYIIQIYGDGHVVKELMAEGMDKSQEISTYYEDLGFDVHIQPDVFAYLKQKDPATYARALEGLKSNMEKNFPE